MSVELALLSVRDAARLLGVSERHLVNLTAPRGPLPSVRLGTRRLYSKSELAEFIRKETERSRESVAG
jgi:excisionase family DNA binding protein